MSRLLQFEFRMPIGFFLLLFMFFTLVQNGQAASSDSPAYTLGLARYHEGDYLQAVEQFNKTSQAEPLNPYAYYYLGLSYEKLGRFVQAQQAYQQVIQANAHDQVSFLAKKRLEVLEGGEKNNNPATTALKIKSEKHPLPLMEKSAVVATTNAFSPTDTDVYQMAAQSISVPLKNNANALMVDAAVQQRNQSVKGVFIIDTGATYTSISRAMAEQLGLDLENCETVLITTANGRIEVPKVVLQSLTVNGLKAHHIEATVIPVHHESNFSGLLGLSFIRQFLLTIDPQGGRLIFQKRF